MITQKYEHHLDLRRDKLCPFKFNTNEEVYNSVCNWHHNIEILLVTDGKGHIQYDSEDFAIEKHDIIIVNSGALHRPYSEEGVSFHYVIIDESFCLENGIELNGRYFERCFKSEGFERHFLNAYALYDEYKRNPSPINIARLRLAVLGLVIALCEDHTAQTAQEPPSRSISKNYVKKTLEFLGDHYAEPISLEDVASVCGVTKYHLAREFKRYTGQTVFTYVNVLRCKKAEICISKGMTVTEAARECGFESTPYFSRTYKRLMGRSPSSEKES